MDRNFYDNDFEEFLKQKSDQYKMYPSDRVWNNVYSSLHGRKKWWALGFTLFFIGAGLITGRQVLLSDYHRIATQLNKESSTLPTNPYTTKTAQPNRPYSAIGNPPVQTASRHQTAASTNAVNGLPAGSSANSGIGQRSSAFIANPVAVAASRLETGKVITNAPAADEIKAGFEPAEAAMQSRSVSINSIAAKKEPGTQLKENRQKTAVVAAVSHAYEPASGLQPCGAHRLLLQH